LQRNIFSKCMTAKGYTVIPVQTAKAGVPQQAKPS
jgi:predicted CoA-binding protein